MTALFVCLLALQVPVGEPARLRTVLTNGATILVERVPQANSLSVQLFASSRGCEETRKTNGFRHLIEHLVARGDGNLDTNLETGGGFLSPRTMRDATVFDLELPNTGLDLGLGVLKEILDRRDFTVGSIANELSIMRQEAALRGHAALLSDAAWNAAYGDAGLDPFGSLDTMAQATPAQLLNIERTEFGAENVSVVVAGAVDLNAATVAVSKLLNDVPKGPTQPEPTRLAIEGQSVEAPTIGEAIAVPVLTFRDPSTAATLSAALALAVNMKDVFVTYTPSARHGLVILGAKTRKDLRVQVSKASAPDLFGMAKLLGRRWVAQQLTTPRDIAFWRGLLLVQARDLRPEILSENIDAMTLPQFTSALHSFSSSKATYVEGTR